MNNERNIHACSLCIYLFDMQLNALATDMIHAPICETQIQNSAYTRHTHCNGSLCATLSMKWMCRNQLHIYRHYMRRTTKSCIRRKYIKEIHKVLDSTMHPIHIRLRLRSRRACHKKFAHSAMRFSSMQNKDILCASTC